MNNPNDVIDVLQNAMIASEMQRQRGKTTVLMEAAAKIGACFVCYDKHHMRQVDRQQQVPHQFVRLCTLETLHKNHGPFIFDHYATERLLSRCWKEANALRFEVEGLRRDAACDRTRKCELLIERARLRTRLRAIEDETWTQAFRRLSKREFPLLWKRKK